MRRAWVGGWVKKAVVPQSPMLSEDVVQRVDCQEAGDNGSRSSDDGSAATRPEERKRPGGPAASFVFVFVGRGVGVGASVVGGRFLVCTDVR